MPRITLALIATAFSLTLALSPAARAGIADSPLPVLMAGQTTLHLYSVPGVLAGGSLGTFFSCTSTDAATMQVGVELFAAPGGAPANDAAATSLSIAPGATLIFGTGAAAGISIDSSLGRVFLQGLGADPRHVEETHLHGIRGRSRQRPADIRVATDDHREAEAEGGELAPLTIVAREAEGRPSGSTMARGTDACGRSSS